MILNIINISENLHLWGFFQLIYYEMLPFEDGKNRLQDIWKWELLVLILTLVAYIANGKI